MNGSYDVLCVVSYSYDPHNSYYEVFSVEAGHEGEARRVVLQRTRRAGYRQAYGILSLSVLSAGPNGSKSKFVGKRVGDFIRSAGLVKG